MIKFALLDCHHQITRLCHGCQTASHPRPSRCFHARSFTTISKQRRRRSSALATTSQGAGSRPNSSVIAFFNARYPVFFHFEFFKALFLSRTEVASKAFLLF